MTMQRDISEYDWRSLVETARLRDLRLLWGVDGGAQSPVAQAVRASKVSTDGGRSKGQAYCPQSHAILTRKDIAKFERNGLLTIGVVDTLSKRVIRQNGGLRRTPFLGQGNDQIVADFLLLFDVEEPNNLTVRDQGINGPFAVECG